MGDDIFETNGVRQPEADQYDSNSIKTVEGLEHVRLRPGMYIGKLGDGSHPDDGIYVLIKEVIDNAIDEFRAGHGKLIEVKRDGRTIAVRDYGRGIPLEKLIDSVSVMNTSGKFDENSYKKSVGLNGVGTKATNALSTHFVAQSCRDGKMRRAEFSLGKMLSDTGLVDNADNLPNGTFIEFTPDESMFENFGFHDDTIEEMLRNYSYLNVGLTLSFQGKKFVSKNGLVDLLDAEMPESPIYPIIHLKGEDIEVAITHCNQYGEDYYSFVNGQHTRDGGTHQSAFREALGSTIKDFYNKNMELADVRSGIVAAIAVGISSPTFESQTKTKLGSTYINPMKKTTPKK
jgi:topoisomerase-4 subunit B